jgi:hypothetical protein
VEKLHTPRELILRPRFTRIQVLDAQKYPGDNQQAAHCDRRDHFALLAKKLYDPDDRMMNRVFREYLFTCQLCCAQDTFPEM